MSQQIVAAGGAGLVTLAFWTGKSRDTITAGLFDENATAHAQKAAHSELVKVGAAVLFVGAATLLAGQSRTFDSGMTAVIVGLFVLWAINRYAPPTPAAPRK